MFDIGPVNVSRNDGTWNAERPSVNVYYYRSTLNSQITLNGLGPKRKGVKGPKNRCQIVLPRSRTAPVTRLETVDVRCGENAKKRRGVCEFALHCYRKDNFN